jgi:hypothetical protein
MKTPRILPALAASSLAAFLSVCAGSTATAADVPADLKVPADQKLSLEARAKGVQIYECKASKTDPKVFEWAFKAPEAELFDSAGARIGKHFAGPTWESTDGSKVVGAVKAKDDGPDPGAIPWLLLGATSSSGTGVLGRTLSVQRLETKGGKAPATGCDAAHGGSEARVPYTAVYDFYVAGK